MGKFAENLNLGKRVLPPWLLHLKCIRPLWKIYRMSSTGEVSFSNRLLGWETLFKIHIPSVFHVGLI